MSVVFAVPGSDILCLPQKSSCKNVQFEFGPHTVDNSGLCKLGLRNVSSLPVKLKSGFLPGESLPYSENVKILDDFSNNQIDHISISQNGSQVPPLITKDHLSNLDIPDHDRDLLTLLNFFSEMLSLPGEALGHTSVIQHAIHLTHGSKSSCTPS